MANLILIHGTAGHSQENWFPWLKNELESLGHNVFAPDFPTPKDQTLQNWFNVFKDYEEYLNEDTVLIGHSLGPSFILRILEKTNVKVKACFFVAGFIGFLNNPEFDTLNKDFVINPFNWNKINANCEHFTLIIAEDDPYVPLQKGIDISKQLNASFHALKKGAHLNEAAGFTEFPFLLELVKKEL